jgi:hypothetical protein
MSALSLSERLQQIRDVAVFAINNALPKDAHLAGETLDEAIRTLGQLQRFKAFVHQRLDEAGVPTHPEGAHSAAGCRVGDRLDIALASTAENTRLRAALAVSKDPCVYCQLPAEEMAKCKSGFPGCARMDDLTGCPEFGAAMELADLKQQLGAQAP